MSELAAAVQRTLDYHQRSKHYLHQYARSLGYLDWSTQPDPFRTFVGAPRTDLPLAGASLSATYGDLFTADLPAAPLELKSLGGFFELSLGLSAWKEHNGSRWALRCNPSSGNLHPTEGYAVVPSLPDLPAGVYHYVSRDHCLERRCELDSSVARCLPKGAFLVGLSSIHWREAWKYGERAFRYCQHDIGHAIAAVGYAAAVHGWSALLLDHAGDAEVAAILGLDRAADFAAVTPPDREHPDALLLIQPNSLHSTPVQLAEVKGASWTGRANPISPDHVEWPVINSVAEATWKPSTAPVPRPTFPARPPLPRTCETSAAVLIRQRRSCLDLDGKTSISADQFFAMLDHLLPRTDVPPWDALPWEPHIHAGIFVHRVRGVPSGLYLLERDDAVDARLRAAVRAEFSWKRVEGCPSHLPLFLLKPGDFRETAQVISCRQEIAAYGAFSLGMIADFGETIRRHGAWWYRRLFWEAGMLGQVLYLEAEAAGVRSTGIGCYFDDVFHDLLGLRDSTFQDLYHFTVGVPVEDRRLTTLPAYTHFTRG
ncbi:MAG: SagB/ThcOx family dehydrogenase [Gemmataceae bacterium]|nr:SagB/ThcOx family dehydrogenase [Gemmataceae bacterium]